MKRFLLVAGVAVLAAVAACKEERAAQDADATHATAVGTAAQVDGVQGGVAEVVGSFPAPASAESETTATAAETTGTAVAATAAAEDRSFPRTVYYQCGDKFVEFSLSASDKGDMRIANVAYAMEQTISASGAKFQNLGDPETYLWSKGEKADLRINGVDAPECIETQKPKAPEKPYRASGNEPGWYAVIENNGLKLVADYGEVETTLPVTQDTREGATRTVTAEQDGAKIVMTIRDEACQDGMSGEAFAHRVTLGYNDKTYEGCGKSLIRDVTWVLEDINNEGIIDNSHLTATFGQDGRVYGRSGCNNYNGSYTLEGENINVGGNMAATMMACIAEAVMQQEMKFLKTLPLVKKAVVDETGALILTGDDGARLLFREKSE